MTIKVVTSFTILMRLARDVGNARKSGDADLIKVAVAKLKEYEQTVLKSDQMSLNMTNGALL